MPDIYENLADDTRLGPALRDSLAHFDTVEVATGYLDLRGWREFAGIIDERSGDVASPIELERQEALFACYEELVG